MVTGVRLLLLLLYSLVERRPKSSNVPVGTHRGLFCRVSPISPGVRLVGEILSSSIEVSNINLTGYY